MNAIFSPDDLRNWGNHANTYFLELLNGEASLQETREDLLSFREVNYSVDGDMICATRQDFVNLQESVAGFGEDEREAKKDLIKRELILCESNYIAPLNGLNHARLPS